MCHLRMIDYTVVRATSTTSYPLLQKVHNFLYAVPNVEIYGLNILCSVVFSLSYYDNRELSELIIEESSAINSFEDTDMLQNWFPYTTSSIEKLFCTRMYIQYLCGS